MTDSLSKQVSIIVPTFNRSDFIARLLWYYDRTNFQGVLLIGDSSHQNHVEKNQKTIEIFRRNLRIEYYLCSNMNEPQTTVELISKVKTPYVAWLPDDDFLVTSGIVACTVFLENNPDYSVAHGISAIMELKDSGAFGEIRIFAKYGHPMRDISHKFAAHRLLDHLGRYITLSFGVHRVFQMQEAYSRIIAVPNKGVAELLASSFFVLQGKIKKVNVFYLIRQMHDQRYLVSNDGYDWITGDDWLSSYRVSYNQLVEKLAEQDGIPLEKAKIIVKQSLWLYLSRVLTYKSSVSQQQEKLKKWVRGNPPLRNLWQRFRLMFSKKEFRLSKLLDSTSPYHKDFMPVYQSVTEQHSFLQ